MTDPANATRRTARNGDPRQAGWREVVLVATAVVGAVLGLAVLTSLLPTELQSIVFRTPLAIGFLVVGTVVALVALVVRRPAR